MGDRSTWKLGTSRAERTGAFCVDWAGWGIKASFSLLPLLLPSLSASPFSGPLTPRPSCFLRHGRSSHLRPICFPSLPACFGGCLVWSSIRGSVRGSVRGSARGSTLRRASRSRSCERRLSLLSISRRAGVVVELAIGTIGAISTFGSTFGSTKGTSFGLLSCRFGGLWFLTVGTTGSLLLALFCGGRSVGLGLGVGLSVVSR